MCENKKPYINLWFGNFFEPAFSDKKFLKKSIEEIKGLGFNSIQLDSKSWQDFFDRYEGKEASQYIEMQEYMMECIKENDLTHNFLAIYLNGDNLYPSIRYSPAVIGEGIININGENCNYYKYWSDKAQNSMIEHLNGLFKLYKDNHTTINDNDEKMFPVCTMWDPIAMPSFDENGKKRYLTWLENKYRDIDILNEKYKINVKDFSEILPEQYWFDEEITDNDFVNRTADFYKYTDNMLYKSYELKEYFKSMKNRIENTEHKIFKMPILSQWGVFLNISSSHDFERSPSDLWDTARRGIDPYELEEYVDNCTFTSVPILDNGDANAYSSSFQNSMIRNMNRNREFYVGFYLGRYLFNDIYSIITPAEIIGTAVASGASGYYSYGYCGLDDGGVMHKIKGPFKESIGTANNWANTVIPKIKSQKKKQIAILYPSGMALVEPYGIKNAERHRLDSLGFYKSVCDSGFMADIIHINQIAEGELSKYSTLIIPTNTCYDIEINKQAEVKIKEFVLDGGILFHDVKNQIATRTFNIQSKPCENECVRYEEGIILSGNDFEYYESGNAIAKYQDSKKNAIISTQFGKGIVYSIGFQYGYEYMSKETFSVPPQYKNNEYYPLCVCDHDPFKELLLKHNQPIITGEKDIEFAYFDNGIVIVNHTAYIYNTSKIEGEKHFQIAVDENTLLPHCAVFIEYLSE